MLGPQVSTFLDLALGYKAPQQATSNTIQMISTDYSILAHALYFRTGVPFILAISVFFLKHSHAYIYLYVRSHKDDNVVLNPLISKGHSFISV